MDARKLLDFFLILSMLFQVKGNISLNDPLIYEERKKLMEKSISEHGLHKVA